MGSNFQIMLILCFPIGKYDLEKKTCEIGSYKKTT